MTLPQSHEAVVALVEVLNGAWTAPEAQPERQSGLQHGARPQTDQSSLQKMFRLRLRSVSLVGRYAVCFGIHQARPARPELVT